MISVALATYNGEKYIAEQLQSIFTQTRKVDEIVITDDCSKDDTVAVIRKFAEEHPECQIRLYENEINLGYKENFRKAISMCEGDIIFLSDQDDVWKAEKVAVLESILRSTEEVALVSSSFDQIDGEGRAVATNKTLYHKKIKAGQMIPVPLEDLIFHNISQGCAMAFKKEIKNLFLESFTEELPHDWILNVVAAMQKKCYFIRRALFCYRVHEHNTTGINDNQALQQKNTLEHRTFDAKQAVKVLDLIRHADDVFYQENPSLAEAEAFAKSHVKYLQTGDVKGLLLQNFDSNYKRLKSVKGRLLDIYFARKNNKIQGGTR